MAVNLSLPDKANSEEKKDHERGSGLNRSAAFCVATVIA
jgi:hypothetical protein